MRPGDTIAGVVQTTKTVLVHSMEQSIQRTLAGVRGSVDLLSLIHI
jgi:hypothetical protein